MGGCFTTERVKPAESPEETTEQMTDKQFDGPVKNRSITDIVGIILFAIFVIVFFGLLSHCIVNGDVYRLIYGYDNCGNICGMVTPPETDPRLACKGGNYTTKKYLLISEAGKLIINPRNINKECVEDCSSRPGFKKFLRRCIPEKTTEIVNNFVSTSGISDFFQEATEDLHHTWVDILYLCIIALALSLIMVFALKFFAAFMIWSILICSVALGIIIAIYSWIVWKQKLNYNGPSDIDGRVTNTYLTVAIASTVISVVMLLIIIALRKRIKLVVELFNEAGKAITVMPLLLFEPVITFIALTMVVALSIYFSIWIESSGYLTYDTPSFYYKKDFAMKFTRWYNLLAFFWMTQFCFGCQHMIIAGSVATWFFTRNKEEVVYPIQKSTMNLLRYHLGSVALGSLFIAICQFARAIFKYLENTLAKPENDITKFLAKCCHGCLYCFEKILVYVTRNAYIEVAIYGQSFCEGGHQAVKALTNNILRVAAINTIGDFVLLLSKAVVVIATLLIGIVVLEHKEGVHHLWVPLALVGIFTYFVSHCFFTVYEMVIDTIFLCFCEDCEINDGINKPYFMSKGLMEFVQNSNKVLKVGDGDTPMKPVNAE